MAERSLLGVCREDDMAIRSTAEAVSGITIAAVVAFGLWSAIGDSHSTVAGSVVSGFVVTKAGSIGGFTPTLVRIDRGEPRVLPPPPPEPGKVTPARS
jgi:hypothetical protein